MNEKKQRTLPKQMSQPEANGTNPLASPHDGDNSNNQLHLSYTREEWSGPIPPPDVLRAYNQIYPKFAEMMVTTYGKQAEHRMAIEKEVVFSRSSNMKRGQYSAVVISICAIIGAVACGYIGYPYLGAAIVGTDFAALAYAHTKGQDIQREERKERKKEEAERLQKYDKKPEEGEA